MSGTSTARPAHLVPDQHELAGNILARAFHDDPLSIYLAPDERHRAQVLPWLYQHIVRYALRYDGHVLAASATPSSAATNTSSPLPQGEGPGVRGVDGQLLAIEPSSPTRTASTTSSPLALAGEGPGVRAAPREAEESAVSSAAVWLPPGLPYTPMPRLIRAGLALAPLKFGLGSVARFMAANTVEHLRAKLAPEPHWYLWVIGVEPEQQGRGLGSSLITPMLDRADSEGMLCYLETHKKRNVAFYQKHGFDVVHSGHVPRGGPAYWCLKREARR